VSSTISFAGSGGQLLTPKAPPPMNCLNHVQREFYRYRPRHGSRAMRRLSPCIAEAAAARRGVPLSQTTSLYRARFLPFMSAQLLVAHAKAVFVRFFGEELRRPSRKARDPPDVEGEEEQTFGGWRVSGGLRKRRAIDTVATRQRQARRPALRRYFLTDPPPEDRISVWTNSAPSNSPA
jgi:hypothetical protein